jgi:hypothetical protein
MPKQVGRKVDGTRRARLTPRLLGGTCLSTPGSRLALAMLVAAGTPQFENRGAIQKRHVPGEMRMGLASTDMYLPRP